MLYSPLWNLRRLSIGELWARERWSKGDMRDMEGLVTGLNDFLRDLSGLDGKERSGRGIGLGRRGLCRSKWGDRGLGIGNLRCLRDLSGLDGNKRSGRGIGIGRRGLGRSELGDRGLESGRLLGARGLSSGEIVSNNLLARKTGVETIRETGMKSRKLLGAKRARHVQVERSHHGYERSKVPNRHISLQKMSARHIREYCTLTISSTV